MICVDVSEPSMNDNVDYDGILIGVHWMLQEVFKSWYVYFV